MNRIQACIERYQAKIEKFDRENGGRGLNGKPIIGLHDENALSFQDFVAFQNLQSQAFAAGKLTFEEAQLVYTALGGEVHHGDWPENTSLATKLAITQLMGELVGLKTKEMKTRR